MNTETPRSILSYLVTKRFNRKGQATFAAMHLAGCTGQADAAFKMAKTGPSEWTVRGFVKDIDLDGPRAEEIKHILGYGKFPGYSMETFTS